MKSRRLWLMLLVLLGLGAVELLGVTSEFGKMAVESGRQAGWDALVGSENSPRGVPICSKVVKPDRKVATVAKAGIGSGSYSGSCNINWQVSANTDAGDLLFAAANGGPFDVQISGGLISPGVCQWVVAVRIGADEPPTVVVGFNKTVALPESGFATVSIPFSWTSTDAQLRMTYSATPIGEKGQTHAKEGSVSEEWYAENMTVSCNVDGHTYSGLYSGAAPLSMGPFYALVDPDSWDSMSGYGFWISDLKFCGNSVDFGSSYPRTNIGSEQYPLWEEGVGDTIGFWGSNSGGNYYLTTTLMVAPYSVDFSGLACEWQDGITEDPVIYCTAIRRFNDDGDDIGPWAGTLSSLKALGRITQTRGWHSKDPHLPDVTPEVQIYLDKNAAKLAGIEVGLPDPQYKVEGAGFGVSIVDGAPTTSPVDGGYVQDGTHLTQPRYTNGQFWMFALDSNGDGWGIGPSQSVPPYYKQEDGGPAGVYIVNEDDYTDTYNEETGLWIFALGSAGVGPAVSSTTERRIILGDTPSFEHDLTFLLDGWTLANTSRIGLPWVTDIITVDHRTMIGLYQLAHDHTSWSGSNVSTPDADGNFTVTSSGGTLRLDLASNYIARQGKVGGIGEVAVPTAYWSRSHDACYGQGVTPEPHEAVYSWLGWSYVHQAFKRTDIDIDTAPQIGTVVCRIRYHYDLNGISDNHMSDSTRQLEYSYDPGEVHTIERSVPIVWASQTGWSPVLIDLLDSELPPCALVLSVEWEFETPGDYIMTEPFLCNDPGDPQASGEYPISATIGARESGTNLFGGGPVKAQHGRKPPKTPGFILKFFSPFTYTQGGLSGHYNGAHADALVTPDWQKANAAEHTVGMLNVVIGAETGQDLTTCWSLAAYSNLINLVCGDAWVANYDSARAAAAFTDVDNVSLKSPSACDIPTRANWVADYLPVCTRVAKWTMVPGLPYTFYGIHVVGGRAHGTMFDAETKERIRSGGRAPVVATVDTEAPKHYQFFDAPGSDEHGHWETKSGAVVYYPGTSGRSKYWYYTLQDAKEEKTELGRFATREFNAAPALYVLSYARTLHVDRFGNIFAFWVDKNTNLLYKVKRWVGGSWSTPTTVKVLGEQPTMLSSEKDNEGVYRVVWSGEEGPVATLISQDDYSSHQDDAVPITLDWEPKTTAIQGPFRFVVGYKEGQWLCAKFMLATNAPVPFIGGATEKFIAAGASATAGFTASPTALFVDLPVTASTSQLYISLDGGETWQDA